VTTDRYGGAVMQKLGVALVTGVLLVTTACSSGGTRPTQDELSTALQKGGGSVPGIDSGKVSKKAADCVAKVLVGSRISDRALKAIIDGTKTYQPSTADQSAAIAVGSKIVKCLPAGLGN
jgi:hypothetical protein